MSEPQYAGYDAMIGPLRRAPEWIRSVEPAEILRQMGDGCPDFYGDDFCEECGQRNPTWHVAPEVWTVVFPDGRGPALCPTCFSFAWQRKTGAEAIVEVRIRARRDAS